MIALVQDYMLRFIQQNTFGALLAAVGEPEIRRQVELEARVQREGWIHPLRRPLTFIYTREMPFSPMQATHIPRPQLSNFFRSFTEGFPQAARQRGLRLEWINVGTWNTPEIVILEQHVEAWQLTNDNLARSNARVLEQLRSQAYNRELARLVQEYPLLDTPVCWPPRPLLRTFNCSCCVSMKAACAWNADGIFKTIRLSRLKLTRRWP
jgi:hypothetical protein